MNGETSEITTLSVRAVDRERFDRIREREDRNIILQFKRLIDLWCEHHGLDLNTAEPTETPV